MLEAAIEQINAAISIAICNDHAVISHDDPAHQMPLESGTVSALGISSLQLFCV